MKNSGQRDVYIFSRDKHQASMDKILSSTSSGVKTRPRDDKYSSRDFFTTQETSSFSRSSILLSPSRYSLNICHCLSLVNKQIKPGG